MRIAQIAPLIERVPPTKYGGTERVIATLTNELVNRGHEVTLFASGDSLTKARLEAGYPRSLRAAKIKDIYGPNVWTLLNFGKVYRRQQEFDIIHDHNNHISVPAANLSKTPVVMTMHGAITPEVRKLYETFNNVNYISISHAQVPKTAMINHVGTIHSGLSMEHYPYSPQHEGYLLYVGRISIEKGVHHAIEVAQYLNLPLIIAAKLETACIPDVQYFKEQIEPFLSEQIRWIGEVDEEERNKLMSKALCFLHPVTWPEPFGMALIEAMGCGCPVIAFNKGSIPELISHGKSGFVVKDVDEMATAVLHVDKIDRLECRKYALKNFSAKKMADGYEAIYQDLVEKFSYSKSSFLIPRN